MAIQNRFGRTFATDFSTSLRIGYSTDRRCDSAWLDFLLLGLPPGPTEQASEIDRRLTLARWPRYRSGWQHYVATTKPATLATFLIDNNDFASPRLISAT